MTALSELIARLEAAKEGSRELDAEIALALNQSRAPTYTTSLDAALTLVPDGLCWRYDSALGWAQIFDLGRSPIAVADSGDAELTSYPAPLALCIAALKAREAAR